VSRVNGGIGGCVSTFFSFYVEATNPLNPGDMDASAAVAMISPIISSLKREPAPQPLPV
jgi:hypothetical protein